MHCRYFDITRKGNHSSYLTPTVVCGWRLFPAEICAQSYAPLSKHADFDRFLHYKDAISRLKTSERIHKIILTSFLIALCGQRCRRHVVGQRVVSDINVVRSCTCVLNLTILISYYACSLLYLFILLHTTNITWPTTWRRVLSAHYL